MNDIENMEICSTCTFAEYFPTQKPCLICIRGKPLRVSGEFYQKEILTRRDLLRRKTDEELAKWLTAIEMRIIHRQPMLEAPAMEEDWLEWLKQEAEE